MRPEEEPPEPLEVLALAQAVMRLGRRRVLLLDTDNNGDGWVSLDEAARSGRAFTAHYRSDLLCIDADSERTAAAASTIADELSGLGFRPVEWASGRTGHRQVIVHIPDDRLRLQVEKDARGLGIDVRRHSRPPLSPHRLGLPVALIRPQTVQEALDALGAPLGAGQPSERPTASARTWRLIRWGDPTAQSGSEAVYRIACGLIGRGFTPEHGYALLVNPQNKGGEALRKRLRERGERAARTWFFDEVWPDAEQYVAENPPIRDATQARIAIAELRAEADRWKWSTVEVHIRAEVYIIRAETVRVAGPSVRRALEGVCDIASTAGTVRPYVGERHLADVAGFGSRATVRKALRALVVLGWIEQDQPGKGRAAATYRLLLAGQRCNSPLGGDQDERSAESARRNDPQQGPVVSDRPGIEEGPPAKEGNGVKANCST